MFASVVMIFGILTGTLPAAAQEVDLEIVLAVDASGSVSQDEFELQIGGIAEAFRDPAIVRAIGSGPRQKIAASLLIWSDAALPKFDTGWHIISSARSSEVFAGIVQNFRKRSAGGSALFRSGGGTGIGDGVARALDMISGNGISAARRVVDVSGDGIETPPWFGPGVEMPEARRRAAAEDVTINGLAILTDFPALDTWYRLNVITGAASFVIEAQNFNDFRRAIREKLHREISVVVGNAGRSLRGLERSAQ